MEVKYMDIAKIEGGLIEPKNETISSILSKKFDDVMEDSMYFYLHESTNDPYYELYWVIEKKSKKLFGSSIIYLLEADVFDNAKPTSIQRVKESLMN